MSQRMANEWDIFQLIWLKFAEEGEHPKYQIIDHEGQGSDGEIDADRFFCLALNNKEGNKVDQSGDQGKEIWQNETWKVNDIVWIGSFFN